MFGWKKRPVPVVRDRSLSLGEILECDELEPPDSRLRRATFLDLLSAQSRAQVEGWKGNAAASGALSLLYDEAVNRDHEHNYLLEEMLWLKQNSIGGLFDTYGRSKDLFGEERIRELGDLSRECRNWISGIMIINRAVIQDLRLFREIHSRRVDDDC
jgi:hypothetical protein